MKVCSGVARVPCYFRISAMTDDDVHVAHTRPITLILYALNREHRSVALRPSWESGLYVFAEGSVQAATVKVIAVHVAFGQPATVVFGLAP